MSELNHYLQHRGSDFDLILRGVIGIFEQQMASISNLLPGSRRSVPYIVETGRCPITDTGSVLKLS